MFSVLKMIYCHSCDLPSQPSVLIVEMGTISAPVIETPLVVCVGLEPHPTV